MDAMERKPAELPSIAAKRNQRVPGRGGRVILVGAGPGDPDLLTLKAVHALQLADVILVDDLVSPEILGIARQYAKVMLAGKTGHAPSCKQQDINGIMVKLAKSGNIVVRLKGGDPMIFGRAGDEIAACRRAGIPVEVVPGISAAQAAACSLGVALTARKVARRLQYVTGHSAEATLPADLDFAALGDGHTTTALYMPVKTLALLAAAATAHGVNPGTPAIAVSRASRSDETIVAGTLGDLSMRLEAANLPGPVIVLIGEVFADRLAREEYGREPARTLLLAAR